MRNKRHPAGRPQVKLYIALLSFTLALQSLPAAGIGPDQNERQSLREKAAGMLMVGFRGYTIQDSRHAVEAISQDRLGGVILFDFDVPRGAHGRNIHSEDQVRDLISALSDLSEGSLLVGIDQEGGQIARLNETWGFNAAPSAAALGRRDDPDLTRTTAAATAEMLADLGIGINMAPVVDIDRHPDNPVIGGLDRAFGADPDTVTRHARAVVEGHRTAGVATALKHFPGHGSSAADSHLGFTDVTGTWEEIELEPYRSLLADGAVDTVMTAHVFNEALDDTWPATLSPDTISGLLRSDLGFHGVVISDDMQMLAIRENYDLRTALRQALLADVDILLFANNSIYDPDITRTALDIIMELVRDGEVPAETIERSHERLEYLRQRHP